MPSQNSNRKRRIGSLRAELVMKSRESALASVQIFNNPHIKFKSELFIVTMCIAWTYLLHAYYRSKGIDYRYYRQLDTGRKQYSRTKSGAFKHWELERCLNCDQSPIDKDTANNLRFLIGLRHEIEHQMTTRIDDLVSARFQACCINFNRYIKQFFGEKFGLENDLTFSLQFSSLSQEQVNELSTSLPEHISRFIEGFDVALSEEEFNSERFGYRVIFVPKVANQKGQADQVIEFIKADSPLAKDINRTYTVIKETERPKYLPSGIVKMMQAEGYALFTMNRHAELWKSVEAKDPARAFGTQIANNWYWYESWLTYVRTHCLDSGDRYRR